MDLISVSSAAQEQKFSFFLSLFSPAERSNAQAQYANPNQAVCPYPSFSGYQNCPAQARHICATRPTRRHERDRQREEGGGCQNESERKTKPGLPPCLLSLSCTPVPPLGLVACKSLSWGGSSFGRDVDTPSGNYFIVPSSGLDASPDSPTLDVLYGHWSCYIPHV